jgi:undecaprenyl-diphosphatase
MFFVSDKYSWIGFYILLVVFVYLKLSWQKFLTFLFSVILIIGISDYFTSGFMKLYFKRLRPSHEIAILDQVHIVNKYRAGKFSFASSHSSNSFAIATLFFLLFRWKWILIWAFLISYSRIYLGVHYPLDIFAGGVVGITVSFITFKVLFDTKTL